MKRDRKYAHRPGRRERSAFPPHRPLHLLVLAALLLPAWAGAQEDDPFSLDEPAAPAVSEAQVKELTEIRSVVEIGIGFITQDSFRFGKFNGLDEDGPYGIFNIDYYRRGAWNGDDADYVRIRANDLGLDSRSIDLEVGRQGDYRVRAWYDEIPSNKSDSARTIFLGAGGSDLALPTDWVPAQTTAGMTRLLSSLRDVDLRTERQRFGAGLDKLLPGDLSFSVNYQYEEKDGLKVTAGTFGNTGGNPRSAFLPEPVDYQTHTIDLVGRYIQDRTQIELRYHASIFDNANAALRWRNPFSAINGWVPSAGFPTGVGELALPPDNTFHQGTALFGYQFDARNRVVADIAIGRMSQNDPFLAFTVDPILAAAITEPLPRDSLDGRIDTLVGNLRYSGRLTDRLSVNASYRYDERDNQTPSDRYAVVAADSLRQDTSATSSRIRFNAPYSYEENALRLDLNYRLGNRTTLNAQGEYRDIDRTFTERNSTEEWRFGAGLIHRLGDSLDINLKLASSDRDGSQYDGSAPFREGFTPEHVATIPGGFENAPGLRRFHLADRDRDSAGLLATWTPSEFWSLGLDINYNRDDYTNSEFGLTGARVRAYTLEFNATPVRDVSSYAFFTHEENDYDQTGVSFQGGNARIGQVADPARFWQALHRERIDTAGLGVAWQPSEGRYRFGLDLLAALSKADVVVSTGAALTSAPLPSNRVRLNSATLYGSYAISDSLAVRADLWHERYRSEDFALDLPANQLANVILFGEEAPDFDVTAVGLTLIYSF